MQGKRHHEQAIRQAQSVQPRTGRARPNWTRASQLPANQTAQVATQNNPAQAPALITAILALAAAAVFALALAGCSASDEQVIRDGLTTELEAFKNPTEANLAPYIGQYDSDQLAELEATGVDLYEFLGHALRGFDYEIGDISVDGDKATANVKLTNVDVRAATAAVLERTTSDKDVAAKVEELAEAGDQAKIMEYVFSLMYDELDAQTETISTDLQLKLVKDGNTWNLDSQSMSDMLAGLYGGIAQ